LVAVFLMANATLATAQGNATVNESTKITTSSAEQLFIHTNATTFLTGETLHCKVYCIDPATKIPGAVSKIAYIELIDSDKKTILNQKINLENGTGQADFFIPATLKTGNFKLIGYTQWILEKSSAGIFTMDLLIINPFQLLPETSIDKNTGSENTLTENQEKPVISNLMTVQTDKKTYINREKVVLKLKSSETAKGNYSLSIRKIDALPVNTTVHATTLISETSNLKKPSVTILPELRGELLSGSIVGKNGEKNISNKSVALSIPGKSFAFKIVKTNASGKFIFVLDDNPDASEVVLQVMEEDRDNYNIIIDAPKKPELSAITFLPEVKLNPGLKNAIEQRSVANQVENAYYERKKDSTSAVAKTASFYDSTQKTYALDDYTRFPTLKETITEVILEMYTKTSKGKQSIHLRNNTMDPEVYGLPLILVDGLLIQDSNELYDYNTENIDKVDLINEPYIFGPKTFSGIANFITKNTDYETKAAGDYFKKVSVQRPSAKKIYFNPDYTQPKQNSRIPDYRQQLLWMPAINMQQNEQAISFFTSDISGKYEVVLEGFTDKGSAVFAKEIFEVK